MPSRIGLILCISCAQFSAATASFFFPSLSPRAGATTAAAWNTYSTQYSHRVPARSCLCCACASLCASVPVDAKKRKRMTPQSARAASDLPPSFSRVPLVSPASSGWAVRCCLFSPFGKKRKAGGGPMAATYFASYVGQPPSAKAGAQGTRRDRDSHVNAPTRLRAPDPACFPTVYYVFGE